jgi:hypothetical protein
LLFMAGNTAGVDWTPKGKVGRDVTVEQGLSGGLANRIDHAVESTSGLGDGSPSRKCLGRS